MELESSIENTVIENNDTNLSVSQSPYILEIKTVQSAFRILIEALKEILTDAMEFDSSGLKVIAADNSHTVLVHLKLEAGNFEQYYCPQDKFLVLVC